MQVSNVIAIEGGENAASFRYHYQRPQCLENAKNIIKNVTNDGSLWIIAVSNHNNVILDFKKKSWP